MKNTSLKEESKEFIKLISLNNSEEKTIFDSEKYIGFSLKKKYKGINNFSKIKNKEGKDESICLIRVGYNTDNINENNDVNLFLDASLRHEFYNNTPSINNKLLENEYNIDIVSVKEFNGNQKFPLSLNSNTSQKFIYNTLNKKFYIKKNHKEVNLRYIVNDIYNSHIRSMQGFSFYKVKTITNIADFILFFGKSIFYKLGLKIICGLKFNEDLFVEFKPHFGEKYNKKDFDRVDLKEIKNDDLIIEKKDYYGTEINLPFFGGKLYLNKRGLLFSIISLSLLALFNKCGYIISQFELFKDNEIILAVLSLSWLIMFHILFEYIIIDLFIYLLNFFGKIYKLILNSVSIKGYDFEYYKTPFNN